MDKASWHEFLVYALNRPLAFAIMDLAARLGRVAHLPPIGTFVNDAEIAREVLTDTEHFDSHSPGSLGVLITQALGSYALLNMDGPEHRQVKRLLLDVFSNKYISLLLDTVTDPLVAELRADLAAGCTVDFVAFMKTFASAMACAMMGVTVDSADERRAYADMFSLAREFTALAGLGKRRLSAAEIARAHRITNQLAAHIRDSYDSKTVRENSLAQKMRALGFPFEAAKGVIIIVMIGATELITYGVPRMLALLVDSGQMAKLRARPDLLDQAVDEGFRMVTPSNVVLRAVTADREISGVRFRRGTRVLVVFRTIMRRDRHFPNGTRFDIERKIDPRFRRLLFGAGPHTCLGTGLALAEARQVLGAVCKLDDEIEIVARHYNRGQTYPGYSNLAIRLRRHVTAHSPAAGENPAQSETRQRANAAHAPGSGQSHI
jgi:cytochrome P450